MVCNFRFVLLTMKKINTKLLINLVEERPVIWGKTMDLYKDKNLKESTWEKRYVYIQYGCTVKKTDTIKEPNTAIS